MHWVFKRTGTACAVLCPDKNYLKRVSMSQQHNLILHNYFRSSAAYRVRIAMNLKGLDYDYLPVHLTRDGGMQTKSLTNPSMPNSSYRCLLMRVFR